MLRNGFICRGGGELVHIGRKRQKMFRKCLNIFVMQKCSDGDEHFSEHFFQLWNEIANTQKIAG
jgi:hypothetical protein